MSWLERVLEEPPLRLLGYLYVRRFSNSVRTLDHWSAVARPHYFAGVLAAADQAKREGVPAISVFEFGVAGGAGLVELQNYSDRVERQTGIRIHVFGFDTGEGLPSLCGDFRDHPDQWMPSDYRMDVPKLQRRLTSRTALRLGPIRETLPRFMQENQPPIGFVSCDVDLYSSTTDVLKIFTLPGSRMLMRVPMYFDDIDFFFNHRFAGELLAIEEFNRDNAHVRIDVWRGLRKGRVFTDLPWLDRMYVAHNIAAINGVSLERAPSEGCALD